MSTELGPDGFGREYDEITFQSATSFNEILGAVPFFLPTTFVRNRPVRSAADEERLQRLDREREKQAERAKAAHAAALELVPAALELISNAEPSTKYEKLTQLLAKDVAPIDYESLATDYEVRNALKSLIKSGKYKEVTDRLAAVRVKRVAPVPTDFTPQQTKLWLELLETQWPDTAERLVRGLTEDGVA